MKYLLSLLTFLLFVPLVQASDIRIAMEGKFPPFEVVDSKGNLAGFNVDIANALCDEMKVKCQLVRFDWEQLIPALNGKKADAILASMSITDDRKKLVDFSDRYTQTPAYFFAKAHKYPYVYVNAKRLAGLKIGVQADTTYDRYVTAKYGATSTVKRFKNTLDMYDSLVKGDIDLLMDDAVAGYYGFLQTPKGAGYEFVGSAIEDTSFFGEGQGIAVRKGDAELKERFNKALKAILDNGTYEKIAHHYFVFSVY
jgi:arginine/ornithine transport system substrate-binding protein